jgi:hypothetical protein
MSFRVTPAFKEKIDRAAQESGRSLAQEIEFRLEQSLEDPRTVAFRAGLTMAMGMSIGPAVVDGINKLSATAERIRDPERLKPALLALVELVQEMIRIQALPEEAFGGASQDLRDRFPGLARSLGQFEETSASLDKTSKPATAARKPRAGTRRPK